MADQKAVEQMVGRAATEFGSLDLFVSNAAYSDRELMLDANMEGFAARSTSRCGAPFTAFAPAHNRW